MEQYALDCFRRAGRIASECRQWAYEAIQPGVRVAEVLETVEDMIRERLVKALTFEGYDAVGAENGAVALRQLDKDIPDLVIADVLMPDVGGFDFVSVLRAKPETRTVPIVIVTILLDTSSNLAQVAHLDCGNGWSHTS